MSRLYLMLSVAGWAWLIGLIGYVNWRRRRTGGTRRGLDVADESGE